MVFEGRQRGKSVITGGGGGLPQEFEESLSFQGGQRGLVTTNRD